MDNTKDLETQLKSLDLCLKPVTGDGNCLFRALSDQLFGSPTNHSTLRQTICNHIQSNADTYQVYLEEPISEYTKTMRKNGIYGGNLELVACSKEYNVGILIHQAGQDVWYIGNEVVDRYLHIAYHNWEHYDSVGNIGANTGLPNVNPSRRVKKPIGKQSWESKKEGVSNTEKMIMSATGLWERDLERIRELMVKFRGNPGSVINYIFEHPDEYPTLDGDSSVGVDRDALDGVDAEQEVKSVEKNKVKEKDENNDYVVEKKEKIETVVKEAENKKKKKLTAREKKDLKQREKNKKKTKTVESVVKKESKVVDNITIALNIIKI